MIGKDEQLISSNYSTMSRLPSIEGEQALDNTLAITVDADNLLTSWQYKKG